MSDRDEYELWFSLEKAAEILGSTPLNVLMHIKRGLLVGAVPDGAWLVEPDSLAALIEKRRAGEVPDVCQSGCSKQHGCQSCG